MAMDAEQIMELGKAIASDLVDLAQAQDLTRRDILMVTDIAQRLLTAWACPFHAQAGFEARLEADAIFNANMGMRFKGDN